jgi:hypothetical protein
MTKDDMTAKPAPTDVPTNAQLVRAALIAVVVGAVVTVVAILPAELGVDPTGLGTRLGLTAMGELKQSRHHGEHDAYAPPTMPKIVLPTVPTANVAVASTMRSDETSLTLKPNEGAEVKAVLGEGGELNYEWAVDDGTPVNFDFHGEEKGAAKDEFTSYEKGTAAKAKGSFVAPFEGTHGWYWRNRSSAPVTIRVKTSGDYRSVGRM